VRLKIVSVLVVLFCLAVIAQPTNAQTYRGSEGWHALRVDSLKVVLKFDSQISPLDRDEVLSAFPRIVEKIVDTFDFPDFETYSLSTSVTVEQFIDSLNAREGVYLAEPYYVNDSGLASVVGETFTAGFDAELSQGQVDSINSLYHVGVVEELDGMHNVFILKNTPESGMRLLKLANHYDSLPRVRWAQPQFNVKVTTLSPYKLFDYYSLYQIQLKKVVGTFNVASVWDFAGLGRQDTVAVIDDGIALHEDLPQARIIRGMDYNGGPNGGERDTDPRPGHDEGHGMACAGIVGASHTTDSLTGQQSYTGVIGLNPNSRIMPVKIFGDRGQGANYSQAAEAITYAWQHGATVISCSWGGRPGDDNQALNEAIANAYTYGRNGWGCPIIFAAGNSGGGLDPRVTYPARLSSCLAVGATAMDDTRQYYSSYGPELDVVAPSSNVCLLGSIWSLDQMAELGFNPNQTELCYGAPVVWSCDQDYDCRFGGTSASCPVAAGIASLILAKSPTTSGAGVHMILRNSAVPIGGIPPNDYFGYGRVDAFRAILSISHGDVNNDGILSLVDLSSLTNYLTGGGFTPFPSTHLADWNCDGLMDLADLSACVAYLMGGGTPPVKPCFQF
jgi:subtilisin family serine protease